MIVSTVGTTSIQGCVFKFKIDVTKITSSKENNLLNIVCILMFFYWPTTTENIVPYY